MADAGLPCLIALAGPLRGRVIPLGERQISIGRDTSNTMPIADLALSRRHCVIDPDGGGFTIRDIDSLNGTLVNGLPIRMHQLTDGDQIRVGDSALLFVGPGIDAVSSDTAYLSIAPQGGASDTTVVAPADGWESPGAARLDLHAHSMVEHNLVGQSLAMQEVYRRVGRAAPTEATVLIRGESGTGKELVARALHANSARAGGPFIAINCAALPEGLLESELFGHERGAFTGALAQKKGRLEMANGGTAFFDEVGELAPTLQAKLLRTLQEREVERVGGTRPVRVDIRVVAATNRALETAVKEGGFRHDLYYRLNVVSIDLPPLRDRSNDLPLLITYFVRKYAARCKRRIRGVTREARARLLAYDWPGNVRELENAIERAIVLGTGEWLAADDLPEHLLEAPVSAEPVDAGYHAGVNAAKRQIILEAVAQAGGNYAQAARLLRLQPTYLHRLLRNLGLRDAMRSAR